MPKNAVTTIDDEASAFELAAELAELATEDAGRGSENVTANDIAIPYLGILQKMSPECDEAAPEYLPTARPGMIFQNVNKMMWMRDEGVLVVPCAYDRKIVEWIPREAGGGLVAVHEMNTPLMREAKPNEKKVPCLANGHQLIDTSTHIVLYKSQLGGFEPAIISMKSTAQKKSRLWNSLIAQQVIPGTQQPAPRWLFTWRLTTVLEQKADQNWYNWEIERVGVVDMETYKRAKTINEQFKGGQISSVAAGQQTLEDEIPF